MTAATPGTASTTDARKRLAEQAAATCPTVIHVGEHSKHWDPAVVQLIEQARAEGAAEVVARVEALAEKWVVIAERCRDRDGLLSCSTCVGRQTAAARLFAALRGPR